MTRPNGVTTSYEYDTVNRLKRLKHSSASQTIEDLQYGYNGDDEISSISSLNSATLLPTAKTATSANEANRISQFGNASYNFDDKGQTTTKTDSIGATVYNWDARGRMTSANLPNGQTVSYSYDALGRRSARTANNQTTSFVYDGQDVVQDKTASSVQADYINGLGIDDKLKVSNTSGSLYFLKDHLGSTQGLTGVSGSVAEWQRYEAFGQSSVSNSLTRYGYTGRERDEQTGLNYYRARWYDTEQGRFISQDPIGFKSGTANFYEYVNNNPISFNDPSGEILPLLILAGVGLIVGAAGTVIGKGLSNWSKGCKFWDGAFDEHGGWNTGYLQDVGLGALGGAAAAALLPVAGPSLIGAMGVGAGVNLAQYGAGYALGRNNGSAEGALFSAATGAAGGAIGGKFQMPGVQSANASVKDQLTRQIIAQQNREIALKQGLNSAVQPKNLAIGALRGTGGSTASNGPWNDPCGCQ